MVEHEWSRTPSVSSTGHIRKRLLVDARPEIAAEWHPRRNEGLSVADFACGSKQRVWWQCPVSSDHEWPTVIANRAVLEHGCPYCSGKRPSATNNLAVKRPDLAVQWHPTRNGDLTPEKVLA